MSAVRDRDGKAERVLRSQLHALGYRYRLRVKDLPGKPDIVFPRYRVAVFVDGDFWHGNSWRVRGDSSFEEHFAKWSNRDFWVAKITRNMERDQEVTAALRRLGWTVVRLWESDIQRGLSRSVQRVERRLKRNGNGHGKTTRRV